MRDASIDFLFMFRHSVQIAGDGPGAGNGGINIVNEPLSVFRIAAVEQEEIRHMVGSENGFLGIQMGDKLTRFQKDLHTVARFQALDEVFVMTVEEGQEREIFGVDPVDPTGGGTGVFETSFPARKTENCSNGQFHPGFPGLERLSFHLCGGEPLVGAVEGFIVARFEPEIEDAYFFLPEDPEFVQAFGDQALGGSVHPDPVQVGKGGGKSIEYLHQSGKRVDEGIAIREENPGNTAAQGQRDGTYFREDRFRGFYAEFFPLVHAAECAEVPGTADGDLENEALRLARGPEHWMVIREHRSPVPGRRTLSLLFLTDFSQPLAGLLGIAAVGIFFHDLPVEPDRMLPVMLLLLEPGGLEKVLALLARTARHHQDAEKKKYRCSPHDASVLNQRGDGSANPLYITVFSIKEYFFIFCGGT
jgi:hypothetical protein